MHLFDPNFLQLHFSISERRKKYGLGLLFLIAVSAIWVAASICAQYLYEEQEFGSPFIMTYIGMSLFIILFPIKWFTDTVGITEDVTVAPTASLKHCESKDDQTIQTNFSKASNKSTTSKFSIDLIHNDDGRPHWNHWRHAFVALHIAPVMFIAAWMFNAALMATSVTSATVLNSTSCLFVFIMAVCVKEETFHWIKLIGVLLGIIGTCLTALHDFNSTTITLNGDNGNEYDDDIVSVSISEGEDVLWGDNLVMIAAFSYAAYAVQVKMLCPDDEELYSMSLLLAYIGLIVAVPLFPLAIWIGTQCNMNWTIFWMLILRGFLDHLLSEYLHFRAVVLTNATIATVGLGITIPMAFIADVFWLETTDVFSIPSVLGALTILLGFLFVNLVSDEPKIDTNDNYDDKKTDLLEERRGDNNHWNCGDYPVI